MKLSTLLIAGTMLAGFAAVTLPAQAGTICPTTTSGPLSGTGACNLIITFNSNGSVVTTPGTGTTYDGSDDALIGVVNNTGNAISSFFVSNSLTNFGGIFGGMDNDGINATRFGTGVTNVAVGLSTGVSQAVTYGSQYGGADAYYTGTTATSGTVNFLNTIAKNGGTDYFSLEQPIDVNHPIIGAPEPMSIAMLGVGLVGLGLIRRRKV